MKLQLFALAISVAAASQIATAQTANTTIETFAAAQVGGVVATSERPEPAAPRPEPGETSEVRIRIHGDTAVMTARFAVADGRGALTREPYSAVWKRRQGRWALVAEHGNEIKRP